MNFGTNPQHDFPKMRGGIKGRLELFRKFIRFGRGMLPLHIHILNDRSLKKRQLLCLHTFTFTMNGTRRKNETFLFPSFHIHRPYLPSNHRD